MLSSLHITNIAVIKSCDIEFSPGYNVFTGETGAGKSMIIDSIAILGGVRGAKKFIRNGEDHASVSAYFSSISEEHKTEFLEEYGIECDDDGGLTVQREIYTNGKIRTRINSRIVPPPVLNSVMTRLVNIHGQHDNQTLLDELEHLPLLDAYLADKLDPAEFTKWYNEFVDMRNKLSVLSYEDHEKRKLYDIEKHYLETITKSNLRVGEEQELEEKKNKIKNQQRITKNANLIYRALYQNSKGSSACQLIDMAKKSIDALNDIYPDGTQLSEKLDAVASELTDIAEIYNDLRGDEYDNPAAALDEIEDRLYFIKKIKRKFQMSIEDIIEYGQKLAEKLDGLELNEKNIADTRKRMEEAILHTEECAGMLSRIRADGAKALEAEVMAELKYLDMDKVRFYVKIYRTDLSPYGWDKVRFLISTNPGEEPKPLAQIASGGELARIMLAIKTVFAKKEGTETLIYDEVDTGVSGKTAQKIGFKLKECGKHTQILCVTHSAQVASACDHHLYIEKNQVGDRVETTVRNLDENERVNEIARIMGGSEITEKLLSSAKELINQANN